MRLRCGLLIAVPALTWTATPASAQGPWVITPQLGANVAGDVEHGKGGPGASVGYLGARLGFELEFQRYQHFFKDAEVSPLDPAAAPNCTGTVIRAPGPCTDIDTDAMSFMGNVVMPIGIRAAAKWRPYGSAGFGLIRAWTNEPGRRENNLGFGVGGGVILSLGERAGLRAELRYFRALVDDNDRGGVLSRDYGFLRTSLGFTLRFPLASGTRFRSSHP